MASDPAMEDNSFLGVPPPQFQRMLSWELSQVVDYATVNKKVKKKRKKVSETSKGEVELDYERELVNIETSESAYIITNSDGEEEIYYSAPETPELSFDEESDVDTLTTDSLSSLPTSPQQTIESDRLLADIENQKKKGSSKKSKKKRKRANRTAMVDFFRPLCNLFDEKIQLNVEDLELSNFSTVPSLCEMCLRKIRSFTIATEDVNIPYLITSMVSNDRKASNTISTHVQWIEKLLAENELLFKHEKKEKANSKSHSSGSKASSDEPPVYAYPLQQFFPHDFQPTVKGDIEYNHGCHSALPCLAFRYKYNNYSRNHSNVESVLFRPLLHYANYFYPLMVDPNIGKRVVSDQGNQIGLTSAQKVAIRRVNNWINTRYPEIGKQYGEFLKLWPGYVHWARGNLQLAMEAFARAIEELNNPIDKAVVFNETGRMLLYFNERRLAVSHYNKSNDIDIFSESSKNDLRFAEDKLLNSLVEPCNLTLQAGVWDTGPIDITSAKMARKTWDAVLKCCEDSGDYPSNVWYLHVAAVESKMFVHAGQPTDVRPPDQQSNEKNTRDKTSSAIILRWANECINVIQSNNRLSSCPILHYHLSLLYAIIREVQKSKRTFDAFNDNFAGFGTYDNGRIPGYQFYTHLPWGSRPHPWKNLFDMLSHDGSNRHHVVPLLPLHWRVRLLHPLYPYISLLKEGSTVADHSPYSRGLNLRLTNDGYLTGDLQMDLPPMKTVLIDPYTGCLCFPRKTVLDHWFHTTETSQKNSELNSTLPWPQRLYESDDCVVELLMAHKPDIKFHMDQSCPESNYACSLHRYDKEGNHCKIDLKKVVRLGRKKALLEACEYCKIKKPIDKLEKQIEILFSNGLDLNSQVLWDDREPLRTERTTPGNKTRKKRTYAQFYMNLNSYMVLGESTLRLTFALRRDSADDTCEAIVFVNCSSASEFMSPRVYVGADDMEFSYLWPTPEMLKPYTHNHLKHIRYTSVVQSRKKERYLNYSHTKLTFDEKGDIVRRIHYTSASNRVVGSLNSSYKNEFEANILIDRYFKISSENNCVVGHSVFNTKQVHQSSPMHSPRQLFVVPGMLLVECENGVVILHPGTLERLNIAGSDDDSKDHQSLQDGLAHPQFTATDANVEILAVHSLKEMSGIADIASLEAAALLASLDLENSVSQDSTTKMPVDIDDKDEEEGLLLPDDIRDYGSACVVLSINDRLLMLECLPRTDKVSVKLDIKFPGQPLDFHVMKGYGYLVTASQFNDVLRSDLYWISSTGKLMGMLPCLGTNPHSLFSTYLSPRRRQLDASTTSTSTQHEETSEDQEGGMHVFFNDGVGGICCLRLKDVLN